MGEPVRAMLAILIMAALSFFIYIFMIPEYPIYSEYDNYVPNITDVQQEVDAVNEWREIVSPLISVVVLITLVIAFKVYDYRTQKKYQESSSVPEAEESVRNE